MSEYYTILRSSESLYKEKRSKFIGRAFPVLNESEIKNRLDEVKKEYHDARHHCFAWILGLSQQYSRANDDGEPSHTAGDPILGQIKSHDLTNVLVIVVRYFGGTKLGVGGLINAYKTAADEALASATKSIIFEMKKVEFQFDYPQISIIERLIADFEIDVNERNFRESCTISAMIKTQKIDSLLNMSKELYNIKILITE